MTRCKYCGKEQSGEFYNPACCSKYEKIVNNESKVKKGFSVAIVVSAILSVIAFIISGDLGIFVLAASVGSSFIIFPFATPQTFSSAGVAKSIIAARVCGVICIILGLVIASP